MSRSEADMNELEKLRVVLPHWVEHNIGHGREFEKWAETLSAEGEEEIAVLLRNAHSSLRDADAALREALLKAGGSMNSEGHHHHHHHDDDHDHDH